MRTRQEILRWAAVWVSFRLWSMLYAPWILGLRSARTSATSRNTATRIATLAAFLSIPESRTAKAVVHCPAGLSAGDEFYLWGLLALTFAQPQAGIEFQATPHFCLRKLGLISADSKGGKSYRLFRDALRRLSAVRYQNEGFFDPIRREHRSVSFGLFSYSLPLAPDSSRAWRILWDPLFFEYCQAAGSQFAFDLETYRLLDHASRRLFLILTKVFWRRPISPCFDVRHLAVHVLGFSPELATRTLKAKMKRCAGVLQRHEVLAAPLPSGNGLFRKQGKGRYLAQFHRGSRFANRRADHSGPGVEDSPLYEPLRDIGFDTAAVARILARFPIEQIQLWADVTLAAIETRGPSFFRKSPPAFFMDSIQNAVRSGRTPPEWFWDLRQQEQRRRDEQIRCVRRSRKLRGREEPGKQRSVDRAFDFDQSPDELVSDLLACFRAAGQSEQDALRNARRFAEESARRGRQPTST